MDEDLLTPRVGRLIDAAKAAAAAPAPAGARPAGTESPAPVRTEGWAVLGLDGKVYPAARLGEALASAAKAGTQPEALAFAVAGESDDTLIPAAGWREGAADAEPTLPVALKYLGRWVLVALGEIPGS